MFKTSVAGQKWAIAKVVIAICALAFAVYMIYCGINYINFSNNQDTGREITPSDYGTLTAGEKITGTIDSVVCQYQTVKDTAGYIVNYYLVKSDDKMITLKAQENSSCDEKMIGILNGSGETLHYKGYVGNLSADDNASLSIYVLGNNILAENKMRGNLGDHIMPLVVNIKEYDDRSSERAVFGAFAMAAFMIFIAFMLLKKPVKDFIYSIRLSKGKIVPEVQLTPDEPLEIKKNYESSATDDGFFYVGYDEQEKDKNNEE